MRYLASIARDVDFVKELLERNSRPKAKALHLLFVDSNQVELKDTTHDQRKIGLKKQVFFCYI
jgi:hypothetical protein